MAFTVFLLTVLELPRSTSHKIYMNKLISQVISVYIPNWYNFRYNISNSFFSSSSYKMQRNRNAIFKSRCVERELSKITQSIRDRAFKPSAFQEQLDTSHWLPFTWESQLWIITQSSAPFKKHKRISLSYQRTAKGGGDAGTVSSNSTCLFTLNAINFSPLPEKIWNTVLPALQ